MRLFKYTAKNTCSLRSPSPSLMRQHIKKTLLTDGDFQDLAVLSGWVMENEKIPNFRIHEVIAEYLKAYQEGIAREIQARGRGLKK